MKAVPRIAIAGELVSIDSVDALAEIRRVMLTTSTTAHQLARRFRIGQGLLNRLYASCTTEAERVEARAAKIKRRLPADKSPAARNIAAREDALCKA